MSNMKQTSSKTNRRSVFLRCTCSRPSARWAGLAIGVLITPLFMGCKADKLFPNDLPRSPFSRYSALRGGEPPMTETDEFNQERPALRARLTPTEQR